MRYQTIVFTFTFVLIATGAGFAQTNETPIPKVVRGGVINGKAVELVKPKFPAAAGAIRASGSVNVQVTIDEQGVVIAAEAISGHPLLRAASVEAAKASRFSPTLLSGQPVKVIGIIVYNFISEMSMIEIGYEMAVAERSAEAVKRLPIAKIVGNIPNDWIEEKEELNRLSNQLFTTSRQKRPEEVNKEPAISSNENVAVVSEGKYTIAGATPEPKIEDIAGFLKDIRVSMEKRFDSNDLKGWYFGLGTILAKIDGEIDGGDRTSINLDELNRHVLTAPLNVSQSILNDARALAALKENGKPAEFYEKLRTGIKSIKNSTLAQ